MSSLQGPPSHLYRRLRTLRFALPVVAFLPIMVYEAFEHLAPWPIRLHLLAPYRSFLLEALLFSVIGPAAVWLTLTWVARRVRERDRAEDHLRSMYQISNEVITAAETEELVKIALRMPEQVVDVVGTAVVLQEHSDGPWMLAGTHGFREEQREALAAYLMSAGARVHCTQCTTLASTARRSCPLLGVLPKDLKPEVAAVACLPLSAERPPLAMLNVYLPVEADLAPATRHVLQSMTSALAVAMDRARLRARALQMAYQMGETVRRQDGLVPSLRYILENIALALRAEDGAVFLASRQNGNSALIPIAAWPGEEVDGHLTPPARQALREGKTVVTAESGETGQVLAVPLVAEGLIAGVLVLAGRPPFTASVASVLNVAPGMIALMIRNNQLYCELESQAVLEERSRLAREVHDGLAQSLGSLNFKIQEIDRLLVRERWEAVRLAAREAREQILDIYTQVRQSIQYLRWSLEEGQGLAEVLDQCVAAVADRTGLAVSLTVAGESNLSRRAEVQLLRIVQEALTNVHRHAQAQHAWVRLLAYSEGTTLEVEDDGVGLPEKYEPGKLPPEETGHFGLHIIRERAEAVGGRMSLHSVPGQGTKLQITVPTSDISIQSDAVDQTELYGSNGLPTADSDARPDRS